MQDTPELPPELESVLDDLLVEARNEPLLAALPAKKLAAAVREALIAEAPPMIECIAAVDRARANQRAALQDMAKSPGDASAAAVGRAGMLLAGAEKGVEVQRQQVLDRAKWPHSPRVLARRAQAAEGAKHLLGPLRQEKVLVAQNLEKSLGAFLADARAYLRSHQAELAAARDFAGTAAQRFGPPHAGWLSERKGDMQAFYDQAIFNVMESILQGLDQTFREWGSPWTSNVQMRYIERGASITEAQAAMHERAHNATRRFCTEFGVEVPGHA